MKEIIVYQTDNGKGLQDVYLKKSAALAAEAKQATVDTAKKLIDRNFTNTKNQEVTARAFTLLLEQAISPGKLNRIYRKLWKIRCAVQAAAVVEEQEEEIIPF